MARLWADSFDHYDTAHVSAKYTTTVRDSIVPGVDGSLVISPGTGRCGTNSLHLRENPGGTYIVRGVQPGDNRMITGMSVKRLSGSNSLQIWGLLKSASYGLRCYMNISGGFDFVTDSGALASEVYSSPGGLFQNDISQFIEWKIDLSNDAVGTITIQVNGVQVWTTTGIETFADGVGAPPYTGFLLGGANFSSGAEAYIDDWYLLDGTGSRLNDFLGDVRVEALEPTSAGGQQQWTLGAGSSHWSAVDDGAAPDDDTTYIESNTVAQVDTNVFEDSALPTTGTVHAVQVTILAKKDQPGNRLLAAVTRQSATNYVGSNLAVNQDSYTFIEGGFDVNPATGVAWTITEVNNAEFGVKVTA
jgi:hypothetical protein